MSDENTQSDPLLKLVVDDAKAADRQLLARLLEPYIYFDKSTKEVNFKDKFKKLSGNAEKLEMLFVGSKAGALIFGSDFEEGLSQVEIVRLEIMPPGSVKATLKKLYDEKKVKKNEIGKYYLPSYRITEVSEKFSKEE